MGAGEAAVYKKFSFLPDPGEELQENQTFGGSICPGHATFSSGWFIEGVADILHREG
jgi:hypothetical protein